MKKNGEQLTATLLTWLFVIKKLRVGVDKNRTAYGESVQNKLKKYTGENNAERSI